MSMRYPGGLIATSPVNARYPSGVWTQAQAAPYQAQNVWTRDQFWPYTTLLLQGDGAVNGAQNNTFLDSSSNNFTITRNGNTTQGSFTPYEQDGYWSNFFDGSTNSFLSAPDNAAFNLFGSSFTIEGWVFPTRTFNGAQSGFRNIISKRQPNGSASWNIQLWFNSNKLGFYNQSIYLSTSELPLNAWTHFAYVSDGTSSLKLYINGVLDSTFATAGASANNTEPVRIGSHIDDTGTYNNFGGYISNLRVVKGSQLYAANFTPSVVPLTAITNTSLLTCQSNRFRDNSTNNFTISTSGSPSVQAFQPFPGATTWSASVLGGSGYFDGSGDYLSAATNTAFNCGTGNFTIEAWVNIANYPGSYPLIIGNNNGSFSAGALALTAQNSTSGGASKISLAAYDINSGAVTLAAGATNTLNSWIHVALVRNGTSLVLYINGASSASTTISAGVTFDWGKSGLLVGGGNWDGANSYFAGYINDLRLVKGTAVYTTTFTPPTAPLTAITNTSLLLNFTNAGIFDAAAMNDLETVGNAQVSTSVVKYGTGSMAFDGSGDYLKYLGTNVAGLGSGNFTIEFWINAPLLNDKFILGLRGGMSGGPHVTTGGYGGTTVGALRWASSAGEILSGTTVITDNTWHHCAIVRNGSIITLYVDGISRGSGTDTTAFNGNGGQILIGENDLGTNTFTGYLDDLRITKGAARYITNFTPPPARMPGQ